MVFILIAGCEIVIAGLAVIIAGLAITISCHEPNFTVDSGILPADSGILPAGTILVGVMGDGMGMWGGVGGNREGGNSANNCSGGMQLFVNKHIT